MCSRHLCQQPTVIGVLLLVMSIPSTGLTLLVHLPCLLQQMMQWPFACPWNLYDLNELGPWVDDADGTGLWTCDDKHANGPYSIWYNS